MNGLVSAIRESLEDIPEAITGIHTMDWVSNHIFYGNSVTPLGTGAMNRGRCPFVRFFRNGKNFDVKSIKPSGGTVQSFFIVEIVIRPPSVKSQDEAWKQGYKIFDNFIADLREKPDWLDLDYRLEQLIINPTLFVVRAMLEVVNSFPCDIEEEEEP